MTPRILMVGPTSQTHGGIASVLHLYADHWQPMRGAFRRVGIFEDGVLWFRLWVFLRGVVHFLFILLTWRPTIVHLHFTWRGSFFRHAIVAWLARLGNCTIIMHSHGSRMHLFYEALPLWGQRFFRGVLNRADHLIVLAPYWKEFYQRIGIETPIYIIPNPVAIPCDEEVEKDKMLVLMLGRLTQHKGTYDVLKVIPAVLDCCETAQFWLCGDGEIEAIRAFLVDKPYAVRVHIPGWIDGDTRMRLLRDAGIFLQPSYAEGLSMAVLEAMASGLPVVGTTVGGMGDVIRHRETGLVIDPGDTDNLADAVCELCQNTELRRSLGAAGQKLVAEQYEVTVVLQALYTFYDTCAAG